MKKNIIIFILAFIASQLLMLLHSLIHNMPYPKTDLVGLFATLLSHFSFMYVFYKIFNKKVKNK